MRLFKQILIPAWIGVTLALNLSNGVAGAVEYRDLPPSNGLPPKIVLTGDLQRTLGIETTFGIESNDAEREILIAAISTEHPSLFVPLGDLVNKGGRDKEWDFFDVFLKPLRDIGTPVL